MKVFEFLQDDVGNFSSKRLFAFLIIISVIMDYQHAIWTGVIWTPTYETIGLALGVVGFVAFGKKYEENV